MGPGAASRRVPLLGRAEVAPGGGEQSEDSRGPPDFQMIGAWMILPPRPPAVSLTIRPPRALAALGGAVDRWTQRRVQGPTGGRAVDAQGAFTDEHRLREGSAAAPRRGRCHEAVCEDPGGFLPGFSSELHGSGPSAGAGRGPRCQAARPEAVARPGAGTT